MTWKQIDRYHLRNGDWTITKMTLANGSKYGLWQGSANKGFFDTANEAKEKHKQLTEGNENERAAN